MRIGVFTDVHANLPAARAVVAALTEAGVDLMVHTGDAVSIGPQPAETLDYLESLEADVWLGAHPFVNGTLGKYERLTRGETPNPFIDPQGWSRSLRIKRINFEKLVSERSEDPTK